MKKILMMMALAFGLLTAGGNVAPVAAVAPVEVQAKTGFYVGGGVGALGVAESVDVDGFGFDGNGIYGVAFDNQLVGTGIVGYDVCEYFAVEGRYNGSIDDVNYESISIFGKLTYANDSDFSPYVLVGSTASNFDVIDSKDGWDFSAGLGLEYALNDDFSVFGDYVVTRFVDNDISADIATVGVKYNF